MCGPLCTYVLLSLQEFYDLVGTQDKQMESDACPSPVFGCCLAEHQKKQIKFAVGHACGARVCIFKLLQAALRLQSLEVS